MKKPRKSADEWMLLSPDGVSVWNRPANRCRFIGNPAADQPHIGFCDFAVDPRGRIIAGTYK